MQQLGIGREGDGLGLYGGVLRDPLEVARAQRAGLVRHTQALGQHELQLVVEPLPPMIQVGTLMRELVLEGGPVRGLFAFACLRSGCVLPSAHARRLTSTLAFGCLQLHVHRHIQHSAC